MNKDIRGSITDVFAERKINAVGFIPAENMDIINPHLLPGSSVSSCIVFLVPYRSSNKPKDNLGFSSYARVPDYHSYIQELYNEVIPVLESIFEGENFFGFADNSPINEKLAAAKAGLGVIGNNSLLINEAYGSFCFIGSLLTTLTIPCESYPVKKCSNCMICRTSCPGNAITDEGICRNKCLSAISQKKVVDETELQILRENNIVWGCDICQEVCPLNKTATFSEIDYFKNGYLENVDFNLINGMNEEEYQRYPFSWRKKEVVLRNLVNITKIDM